MPFHWRRRDVAIAWRDRSGRSWTLFQLGKASAAVSQGGTEPSSGSRLMRELARSHVSTLCETAWRPTWRDRRWWRTLQEVRTRGGVTLGADGASLCRQRVERTEGGRIPCRSATGGARCALDAGPEAVTRSGGARTPKPSWACELNATCAGRSPPHPRARMPKPSWACELNATCAGRSPPHPRRILGVVACASAGRYRFACARGSRGRLWPSLCIERCLSCQRLPSDVQTGGFWRSSTDIARVPPNLAEFEALGLKLSPVRRVCCRVLPRIWAGGACSRRRAAKSSSAGASPTRLRQKLRAVYRAAPRYEPTAFGLECRRLAHQATCTNATRRGSRHIAGERHEPVWDE